MARMYCNIKDFNEKEFLTLKEINFSTISGGVLVYNKEFKVPIDKLETIKKELNILNTWFHLKNSSDSNINGTNKYQIKVWIKLIKRENKNIQLKTLLSIFSCMLSMQNNEYYRKYNTQFCNRIKEIGLSNDWVDRIIRTIHR